MRTFSIAKWKGWTMVEPCGHRWKQIWIWVETWVDYNSGTLAVESMCGTMGGVKEVELKCGHMSGTKKWKFMCGTIGGQHVRKLGGMWVE